MTVHMCQEINKGGVTLFLFIKYEKRFEIDTNLCYNITVIDIERLQKVLAQANIASRRKSEEMILEGRVKVNGKVITELGFKVNKTDDIEVDGKPIKLAEHLYFFC